MSNKFIYTLALATLTVLLLSANVIAIAASEKISADLSSNAALN